MLEAGAWLSRNNRRAAPILLRGSSAGTKRSSPMNQCTRCHGIRLRQASVASNWKSFFGLEPPVRQTATRLGFSAIRAIARSAAALAIAPGSATEITWRLSFDVILDQAFASFGRRAP